MNWFGRAPFIRLLLPFVLGIITSIYVNEKSFFSFIVIAILFTVSTVFSIYSKKYKYRWVIGVLINSALFVMGFYLTILKTPAFKENHFSNYSDSADCYYVKVAQPFLEKEKSLKVIVSVMAIEQNNQWNSTSGNALVYFKRDSLAKQIKYGDCLIINAKFFDVTPPQNPSEFDYKKYLSFHGIYQQAYLSSQKWLFTKENKGNWLLKQSYLVKEKLLNIFTEYGIKGDEYAVGAALVLGYNDKLDSDIISAYASTGALHVLSVSGLHVGIIYLVFNFLFSFLDRIKRGNVFKGILLLIILWLYALLTGLSPSVLRSATMFSLIIVSKSINKSSDIFNTLAVSCFLLLLINPFMIMEVGFQLSYLAVLGIVLIQPPLYELFETNNWLLDQIWALTTVSFAAQIITFPLGLLYFHQFPNYFLFSNLVVIPVSTIILYAGILLFAFSKIKLIAAFLAKLLSGSIWFLNESVRVIEHLPYALLEGISISITETWIIYFSIATLLFFFSLKKIKYLRLMLLSVVLILLIQCIEAFKESDQQKIIVYDIPKTVAYDFINGNQTVFIADSALAHNKGKMLFHVKHNWWNLGIDLQSIITADLENKFKNNYLFTNDNFVQFHDKRIAIISSKRICKQKVKVDYLIISKNPDLNVSDLVSVYQFKKIIIDSSNSKRNSEKWLKQAQELNISCYSVLSSGAFIEDI